MLVWDFDGTLADTFDGIHLSMDEALGRHGFPPVDPAVLRPLIGLNLRLVFARLVGDGNRAGDPDPELIAGLVADYRAVNMELGPSRARLFPGMASLLDDLADQGVVSTMATSKARASVLATLDRLGIRHHFATVVSDDDVVNRKPHPDMVLAACEAQGYPPNQTLVIGDTGFDVEMGRRAGASTCAVTWGNQTREQLAGRRPTYLVDTADELAAVCGAHSTRATSAQRRSNS